MMLARGCSLGFNQGGLGTLDAAVGVQNHFWRTQRRVVRSETRAGGDVDGKNA